MNTKMTMQEKYEFLLKNWSSMSGTELGEKLGTSRSNIGNMVSKVRRMGIKLPRKKPGSKTVNWEELKKIKI